MKTILQTAACLIGLLFVSLFLAVVPAVAQTTPAENGTDPAPNPPAAERKHAIEASPMSPLMRIYVVQYSYQFAPQNDLMLGLSYMNIQFDDGATHAPGVIVGLRHYLWKGLHAEYQLWPAYDWYYEKHEKKYYSGFELWNEGRIGYRFDIKLSEKISLYITPQWALGFGVYGGNKPESFKKEVRDEPYFGAPLVFTGLGF
ncbi:MAG: hypothetical protein GX444_04635 [Myxococcales bacterium]|nr:hypothetical protein [Myxococcales bacterium]